jgi:hypothetical protein
MVHDYWMHRPDAAFARRFLPGVRGVIAWYERHVDSTGMLGPMPWWNFADWAYTRAPFRRGVPPGADDGNSALITLQLAYALGMAADLAHAFDEPGDAARYRALASSLTAAVRRCCWDAARGEFADSPARDVFSQHTNVMAVLAGAVPPGERGALMRRVLADSSLLQAGYYFQFYVNEALAAAGLGDRYLERLAPWRAMPTFGLTTVPETPEPTRSDTHAWSAHPNHGLLATVLGVRPAAPGFAAVRVAPALGPLRAAEGRVAHPGGDIDVRLARGADGALTADVTLPPGVRGVLSWGGQDVPLRAGPQRVVVRGAQAAPTVRESRR